MKKNVFWFDKYKDYIKSNLMGMNVVGTFCYSYKVVFILFYSIFMF